VELVVWWICNHQSDQIFKFYLISNYGWNFISYNDIIYGIICNHQSDQIFKFYLIPNYGWNFISYNDIIYGIICMIDL